MITKLELIEYLKHTPENTNYNILYSSLYNGSNKEIVDEFIEVLSRGNLSLAALQPYLAKLYEDDKTISPEPLPPLFIGGSPDAVLYTPQTLTDAQKKQARENIDALSDFVINGTLNRDYTITLDKTFAQISEAIGDGKIPIAVIGGTYYRLTYNDDSLITFSLFNGDKGGSGVAIIYVYPDQDPQFDLYSVLTTDDDGYLPQLAMAADPTTDMQIATKQYVDAHATGDTGGGSADAVLYTPQTLTDVQKQQARDNIDAAIADFVIHATLINDTNCTLDKTFAQIQEAVQAGKKVYAKLRRGLTVRMPLVVYNTNTLIFGAAISTTDNSEIYALAVTASEAKFVGKSALTYNSDGDMPQVNMSSDPTEAMQIATKKYVDDALDGKAGTAVATASANGLMSKDDKVKLDGITGQVTAANIHAPEHTTDLVQYGAFQIAAQQIIQQIPTVPTALKNPNALTIKIGSTTVTYDGSMAQTVEIADGTEVEY